MVNPFPNPIENINSAREVIDYITAPAYANDVALDTLVQANAVLLAALPSHAQSGTVPDSGKISDRWIDTSSNNQERYCFRDYISGDTPTYKAESWYDIHDNEAKTAGDDAQTTANSATRLIAQNGVPDAASVDWIWCDADDGNQPYRCHTAYISSDFATPPYGGYGNQTLAREAQWELVTDNTARTTATLAQGAADGKTETLRNSGVPEDAMVGDIWLDSSRNDNTYLCIQTYASGDSYDSGTYPTVTIYRESKWIPFNDPVSRALADALKAVSDGVIHAEAGITTGFPASGNVLDVYKDTSTNKYYRCKLDYTGLVDQTSILLKHWEEILNDTPIQDFGDEVDALTDEEMDVYVDSVVPESANEDDKWIHTGTKAWQICDTTYSSGDGPGGYGSIDEFRNAQWSTTSLITYVDQIVKNSKALADNKRMTFYQDDIPDQTVLYQTDGIASIDIGDGWTKSTGQSYICNEQYTGAGDLGKWTEVSDPTARATADAAKALVDKKQNLVYTSSATHDAEWPGPGGVSGQIAIPDWADYDGGMQVGDSWTNIHPSTQDSATRICVIAYTGLAGDLGSTLHWKTIIQDEKVDAALNGKLPLAGGTMTGEITHTSAQQFNGTSFNMSGGGIVGSTIDCATAPTSGNHLVNKTFLDLQIANLVNAAPGLLDTLDELAAAIGDDANFSVTMTNALAGKVAKAGDTMTGDLTIEKESANVSLKSSSGDGPELEFLSSGGASMVRLTGGTPAGVNQWLSVYSGDANVALDVGAKTINNVKAGTGTQACNVTQMESYNADAVAFYDHSAWTGTASPGTTADATCNIFEGGNTGADGRGIVFYITGTVVNGNWHGVFNSVLMRRRNNTTFAASSTYKVVDVPGGGGAAPTSDSQTGLDATSGSFVTFATLAGGSYNITLQYKRTDDDNVVIRLTCGTSSTLAVRITGGAFN